MNRDEIMDTIRKLSKSQGFFGCILKIIEGVPEETREAILKGLEEQHFEDEIALILFLEG